MNVTRTEKHAIASCMMGTFLLGLSFGIFGTIAIVMSDEPKPTDQFEALLDAIEWVESKGDANAIGDNGNAVGSFQIWPIYVDDCNRILGRNEFTLEDRKSRERSREMARVYLSHYCSEVNPEKMARIHNGGPSGHKKESTKAYWLKVKARMENVK